MAGGAILAAATAVSSISQGTRNHPPKPPTTPILGTFLTNAERQPSTSYYSQHPTRPPQLPTAFFAASAPAHHPLSNIAIIFLQELFR